MFCSAFIFGLATIPSSFFLFSEVFVFCVFTTFATFSDESGHRERKADLKQGSWTWPIYKKALDNNPYMTKNLYWE